MRRRDIGGFEPNRADTQPPVFDESFAEKGVDGLTFENKSLSFQKWEHIGLTAV